MVQNYGLDIPAPRIFPPGAGISSGDPPLAVNEIKQIFYREFHFEHKFFFYLLHMSKVTLKACMGSCLVEVIGLIFGLSLHILPYFVYVRAKAVAILTLSSA